MSLQLVLVPTMHKKQKSHEETPMTIYVRKIENTITLKIKILLLTPETMKLFEALKVR